MKENNPANIALIEEWIGRIIGPISISVKFNNETDLYIQCNITISGSEKPIELAGTGYLQLIQIFCYVLLFEPGVLLIDEPDIHLHPHVQEGLVRVLADVASERGIRIILTTHSPFIVRGAPAGTNVCWLQDGTIESQNRSLVEVALGWGAFGKKLIIISEDSKTAFLKKIVSQWPDIDRLVSFYPGNGYKNLPSPTQGKELLETLGGKFKILIHRDRDFLTESESNQLIAKYESQGIGLWFPAESDIEAYFCKSDFLMNFMNYTEDQALNLLQQAISSNLIPIEDQFVKQRAAHNEEMHKTGGGPTNEEVWTILQNKPLKGAKGKFIFKQLKNKISPPLFNEEKVLGAVLDGQVALDLKQKLQDLLTD